MDVQAATSTYDCKFPGCPNEVKSPVGRYSYCDAHRDRTARGLSEVAPGTREIRPPRDAAAPRAKAPEKKAPVKAAAKGLASRLAALGKDARKLDAERARAAELADKALAARRAVEELQTDFDRRLRELSDPEAS